MKIKDLKNDKNLVTIEIEFDDSDEKKLENTSYLQQRSALSPYLKKIFKKLLEMNFSKQQESN